MTTMPVELLTNIAEHIDIIDLLALRLTCKEVAAATESTFVQTFFVVRRHLLAHYSVQILVEISRNLNLRRRLTEIEFVVPALGGPYSPSPGSLVWYCRFDAQTPLPKECEAVWSRWEKDKVAFEARGARVSSIAEALRNLKNAGLVPKLTLSFNNYRVYLGKQEVFGINSLLKHLGPPVEREDLTAVNAEDTAKASNALFTAIAKANYPITNLDLWSGARNTGVRFDHFDLGDKVFRRLQASWTNLTKLELGFDIHCLESLAEMSAFRQLVAAAVRLRELAMDFKGWLEAEQPENSFQSISAAFACSSLEKISLSGIQLHQRALLGFVGTHKATVRDLSLCAVHVADGESWHRVFQWLTDNLTLEHVLSSELRQGFERMLDDEHQCNRHECHGTEHIKRQLKWLAREAEFEEY